MKPDRDITDVRVAKALAHPLRVRILDALDKDVRSPRQLAAELDADLSVVSYHVRALNRLGIIQLVTRKRRRAAVESFYRVVERPVVASSAWSKLPSIAKKAMVDAALDRIGAHVAAAAASGGFERETSHLTRSPMVLDDQGFKEVAARLDSVLADLQRIGTEAEKRLQKSGEAAIDGTAVLMLFESSGPSAASAHDGEHITRDAKRRKVARPAAVLG